MPFEIFRNGSEVLDFQTVSNYQTKLKLCITVKLTNVPENGKGTEHA